MRTCRISYRAGYIYENLSDSQRKKIRTTLCGGLEPAEYLARQEEEDRKNKLIDISVRITIDKGEITHFIMQGHNSLEANALSRAAGYLRLYRANSDIADKKTFRNAVYKACMKEQETGSVLFPKRISSEFSLNERAKRYEREGVNALKNKYRGNNNRTLRTIVCESKLIELASSTKKYSNQDITLKYNEWAKDAGFNEMTVAAIEKFINSPKIRKIWMYNRHGRLAADNVVQQLIERKPVSRPDALWSIDGTPSQLYYASEKIDLRTGKVKREIKSDLYVYFITDVCTSAVIGYSIAFSETAQMVVQALRNCLDTYGMMPEQIQYDNSSANIQTMVTGLMQNMARVAFPCQPYKGRSKYVEGFIGHFQNYTLRYLDNYKGGNITAKSLDARANPEKLKELFADKAAKLPTLEECIKQIETAISEWNNRGVGRDRYGRWTGSSKIERYKTLALNERRRITDFDKYRMFRVEHCKRGGKLAYYTYKTTGITIEIDKIKRSYVVPDSDGIGDFAFAHEHLNEEFSVRINLDDPDNIALYNKKGKYVAEATRKEQFAACVADLKEGEKARIVKFQQKQEQWGYGYAQSELKRQKEILEAYEQKATGTYGISPASGGLSDLQRAVESSVQGVEFQSKNDFNRFQEMAEDSLNGLTGLDYLEQAIKGLL
jgi:hypothetical protein